MARSEKMQWGILGCAGIAVNAAIPGIRQSATGEVAAIASRQLVKAHKTADSLSIPKAYGSYEELLADNSIEAVYIPLPNHLHREWSIRAMEAGKHVLCEKPMALHAGEAEDMAEAAAKAGIILAEAFMYRFHPQYDRLKEIVASGEIGEIRSLNGSFTFNNAGDKDNVRYKRYMGGGSLYDVGCYPISAARFVLEREPEAVTIHAFFSPDHDGVDMMASGLLEFTGGVGLTFDCGMWASGRQTLEIVGTDGTVRLPEAFVPGKDKPAQIIVRTRQGERTEETAAVNQYALQADEFAANVRGDRNQRFPASDAILNMKAIDACLQSAARRERVSI